MRVYNARPDVKERAREYEDENKERIAERMRGWREDNRERLAEYQRAYINRNREHVTERARAYRDANQERRAEQRRAWYETNRESEHAKTRAWRVANRDATRAMHQRRRARKLQAEGGHTTQDIQAQYRRQKGRCYWCSEKVGDDYHVDHIVPLSRGGSDWPENLVIACPTCNLSKKDKLPHEWPKGGRLI